MTNNIMWRWNLNFTTGRYSGTDLAATLACRNYPAQLQFTYSGNIIHFDTACIATNRQAPATPFPDPTRDTYPYAALNGYASETALWQAMVANSTRAWAKSIGDHIRAGYGR